QPMLVTPAAAPPQEKPAQAAPAESAAEKPAADEPKEEAPVAAKPSTPPAAERVAEKVNESAIHEPVPSSTSGTENDADTYRPRRSSKSVSLGSLALMSAASALFVIGVWFVVGPGRHTTQPPPAPPVAHKPHPARLTPRPQPAPAATPERPAE